MNRLFLLLFGAVTFVAHAQVPDYAPTEGLVAWYPFNGNANDESGNGNDGWNQGATPTTDRFDESDHAYAYSTSSNVELPSNSLASSFSFSVWFEAFEPSGEYILDSRINNEAGFAFLLGDSETIQFGFTAQGQYGDIIELQGLTVGDSSWHHAVFTFENDTLKTILDNEIIYSGAQAQETFSSGGTIKLGVRYDYSGHWLEGKIDDIGIWTTALTEDQITALYNAQLTLPGCTDPTACNFNEAANQDDGSCTYPPFGLTDCEAGGTLCGEGTIWDASLQACVGFNGCPSDLDGDGIVGVNDLLSLLSDFGTACPPEVAEWTCGDPVSYHGYDYATVQIGEQCWFAENLRTELYNNGDSIPGELTNLEWSETFEGAQAIYEDSPDNLLLFGRLYNWYAVADTRELCPSNWGIPSDDEWKEMEMSLGMTSSQANAVGWRGVQGEMMRSSATNNPPWNGSNSSGFSGMNGGRRTPYGSYYNDSNGVGGHGIGVWWSSTSATELTSWGRALGHNQIGVDRNNGTWGYSKQGGASVRCLKD